MRSVPQDKYTDAYFRDCCEGFTPTGEPGRRLLTLLGHMDVEPQFQNVLDIGCGCGEVANLLIKSGHNVLSVDYSLAAMNRFHEVNGATTPFIRHDISHGMPWLTDEYFDCVILADVVEHLYHEQLLVVGADASRVVKTGCMILIDTPIMKGGESELHVDIKESAQEVMAYFPGTEMVGTHWFKKPEHCNIILRKTP